MLGWSLAAAGVAALGVGTGFGVASLASYDSAGSLCPSHTNCSDDAMSARRSAETKAWVSNVAIAVGVIGVGVGSWIVIAGRAGGQTTRVAVRGTPATGGLGVNLERTF